MVLQKRTYLILAIGWLALITFLFSLPGSALPTNDWLNKIHFDKWVHFGFFALLLWLWSRGLNITASKSFIIILSIATLYGFVVEVCQDQFIKNRSFDISDWIADVMGALAGVWFYRRGIKK